MALSEPELKPLPPCPYRGPEGSAGFACEAAEGALVTASDCHTCSIPEAVAHKRACLYLVPMRYEGQALFACRCYSTEYSLLAAKDWRHLCFCNYWFPRGPVRRELAVPGLAKVRNEYRRVLHGEVPQRSAANPSPARPDDMHPRSRILRWLQWQRYWWFRW